MFLIRCYKHPIFHKMLISIPGMKRFWKDKVSGGCVGQDPCFHMCHQSTVYSLYGAFLKSRCTPPLLEVNRGLTMHLGFEFSDTAMSKASSTQ